MALWAHDIGAGPSAAVDRFLRVHQLDRHRPLVRVHPDHDSPALRLLPRHMSLLTPSTTGFRAGKATLPRAQHTSLEPLPPIGGARSAQAQ